MHIFFFFQLLVKPWSKVSSLLPPPYMPSSLSRIGFSIPTFLLLMLVDFYRICTASRWLAVSTYPVYILMQLSLLIADAVSITCTDWHKLPQRCTCLFLRFLSFLEELCSWCLFGAHAHRQEQTTQNAFLSWYEHAPYHTAVQCTPMRVVPWGCLHWR